MRSTRSCPRTVRTRPRLSANDGEAVERLLEGLPELYRTVVYLHYWLDATVEEMAELLSVPSGTVKSYLSRARARLRERACVAGIEGVD
jgi:RNA polymerase sigma factor (sigma-70 family)